MKSTVYFAANGDILSVVQVDPKVGIGPLAQHFSLDIDVEDTADTPAEMHSNLRVDSARRTLIGRQARD